MQIRPMLSEDLIASYGFGFPHAVRGFTAEHEGEVIGVAGIMFSRPPQAFSKLNKKIHPKDIVRAMRLMRQLLNKQSVPIYAMPDEDEPTANGFLRHVGFTEIDGVYVWTQ